MDLADPTIAMQVRPLGGNQMANPFEMMSQFANAQRSMVEAQTARQLLQARQVAGQLISNAKDMPSAIEAIRTNPLTAGFASEIMSTMQGVSTSQTQQAGEQQTQATTGLQNMIKGIASAGITDPKAIGGMRDAALAVMSPTARAANQGAYNALVHSLTDGLDDPNMSPDARKNAFNQRLSGIGIGAGMSADDFRALTGSVAPSISMQPNAAAGGATQPMVSGSPDLVSKPGAQFVGAKPGNIPSSLTPDQSAAASALGGQEADTSKAMSEAAEMAPVQLHNIGMLEDAMKVVKTGGGAVGRSALASTAQMLQQAGINIPDSAISELANGKEGEVDGLPASQFIKNALRTMALGNLRTDQAGLGKAYAMEINSAIDSLDNNSDPKTIQTILNKVRYATELQNDRSSKYFNEYYKARQANEVGPNSGADYYNHHFLDDFNKKFEKEHPGVIGAKLPQAKPGAEDKTAADAKKKALADSIFGQ